MLMRSDVSSPPWTRQHLIFDADDTLWENNTHFERLIEEFIDFGDRAFARNLRLTFRQVTECDEDDPRLEAVEQLGLRILEQELEIIPDLVETLDRLGQHHTLYL